MNKKMLYALWGGLYILCAGLGFIPEPAGLGRAVLTGLALAFFIPPGLLLYCAHKGRDRKTARLVTVLSAASLLVTFVTIIVNFLSYGASEAAGLVLYGLLILVSSPMICGQTWVLSLFGWACLLLTGISLQRTMGKNDK